MTDVFRVSAHDVVTVVLLLSFLLSLLSSAKERIACVAGVILGAREIKFWRRSRLRRSLVGSAAKTLFRVRLQYGQLRKLRKELK